MKCQRCNKEYIPSYSPNWDMSCPNKHGHVLVNTQGEPTHYRFYIYPTPEVRITIEMSPFNNRVYMTSHTKVQQTRKNRKGRLIRSAPTRVRKTLLKIDKPIPVKLDKDQFLLVDKLYEKMRIYLLFS